jgi:hypothetical protein
MIRSRVILTTGLVLGLTVLAGHSSFAQPPSGSITNLVSSSTNALWDASLFGGLQSISFTVQGATNLSPSAVYVAFPATFTQDGRGRLSGSGTNQVSLSTYYSSSNQWVDAPDFAGKYVASGSIVSLPGIAKLTFAARASGEATLGGTNRKLSALQAYLVYIYLADGLLAGSYADTVTISGERTLSQGTPFPATAIPAELGDGSWTLVTNFEQPASNTSNKLKGTATVTLNSGATYPFRLTGLYSGKKQQSSLLLTGVKNDAGDGRGSTLMVTLSQSNTVVRLSGRISGQTVRLK